MRLRASFMRSMMALSSSSAGRCFDLGRFVMDQIAVEHAKKRLAKAEKSLVALRRPPITTLPKRRGPTSSSPQLESIQSLSRGAKGKGTSVGWFGRKKNERRDDPLLRYLHFARNSDEHGIERVVSRFQQKGELFGRRPKFGESVPLKKQRLDEFTLEPHGPILDVALEGPTIKLIRVHDRRYGDHCDPPQSHLGVDIPFYERPANVAALALAYLKALVAEAEVLAPAAPTP